MIDTVHDDLLASAGDDYEATWQAYMDAREAWLAMLAARHAAGTACECDAADGEPGPHHSENCESWIPFVPASLDKGSNES